MNFRVEMTDLLIESITAPEPRPGLVDGRIPSNTEGTDTDIEGVEEKQHRVQHTHS